MFVEHFMKRKLFIVIKRNTKRFVFSSTFLTLFRIDRYQTKLEYIYDGQINIYVLLFGLMYIIQSDRENKQWTMNESLCQINKFVYVKIIDSLWSE